MAAANFYKTSELVDHSYINGNVDPKLIQPTLTAVQDVYILPLIGSGLFDEIKGQIINSTTTAANETLLEDYLHPVILWWVMYEFTISGSFKYMNKSVLKRTSESSEVPSIQELERIAKPHKDKAEHYQDRCTRFLLENNTTYPLFLNPGNGIDTVNPEFNNFTSGLNLDDDGVGDRSSMKFNSRIPTGRYYNPQTGQWIA